MENIIKVILIKENMMVSENANLPMGKNMKEIGKKML